VATTPSTTALSTPEPEFAGMDGDWMALAAAEMDEILYQGSQGLSAGEEWFGAAGAAPSPSPSPLMGGGGDMDLDQGFGGLSTGWVQQQQQQQYQVLGQQQAGFDASLVDPRMCQGEYGNAEYYAQGQQELEVPGYGYDNMLGVYQGEVQIRVTQPGMYDGSSGLVNQGQMGSWQDGYTAAGW
jgi:hypothetical protein